MSNVGGTGGPSGPGTSTSGHHPSCGATLQAPTTAAFKDKIDPFMKGSLRRKQRKSQGSSRYRLTSEVELQQLPLLKGNPSFNSFILYNCGQKSHEIIAIR